MTLRIFGHPCYFGHPPVSFLPISPRVDATFPPLSFAEAASDATFNNRHRRGATKRPPRRLSFFFWGGGRKDRRIPTKNCPPACVDRDRRLRRRVWNPAGLVCVPTYLRVGGPSFLSNSKIGLDQLWSRCLLSRKGPPKKRSETNDLPKKKKGGGEGQINLRRFVPSSSSLPAATHADFFVRFLR